MNRVLILFALALSAFTAGCQATTPKYNFPCTYRAYDAGFCEQPPGISSDGRRVLTSVGGAVPGVGRCISFEIPVL